MNMETNKQTNKQILHSPRQPCSPPLWQSSSSWWLNGGAAQTNETTERVKKTKQHGPRWRENTLRFSQRCGLFVQKKLKVEEREERHVPARGRWPPSARCTWSQSGWCADLAAPAGGTAEFMTCWTSPFKMFTASLTVVELKRLIDSDELVIILQLNRVK